MNCGIACKELDTGCLLALYTRYHGTQLGYHPYNKDKGKQGDEHLYELWDRVRTRFAKYCK